MFYFYFNSQSYVILLCDYNNKYGIYKDMFFKKKPHRARPKDPKNIKHKKIK